MKAAQPCLNFRPRHRLSIRKGNSAGVASIGPGQYSMRRPEPGLLHGLGEEATVGRGSSPLVFGLKHDPPLSHSESLSGPLGVDLVTEEASCHSILERELLPSRCRGPWFPWGTGCGVHFLPGSPTLGSCMTWDKSKALLASLFQSRKYWSQWLNVVTCPKVCLGVAKGKCVVQWFTEPDRRRFCHLLAGCPPFGSYDLSNPQFIHVLSDWGTVFL